MTSLGFRFFALVLLLARETSSSSVNYPSSMVIWQNFPVETVVASHMQIAVTINSTAGSQKFHTRLHKYTGSPRETLTSKRYNFPLKFRKKNFVALENANKATFDCQVELPFIGHTKPWIELDTGNIYCIFFPYSKTIEPPHHALVLKEVPHVSAPSFALLLGRLSVSGTRKMMNITSEVSNVIISILENSDVQIHWRKKDYLSMSLLEDFDIAESKVKEHSVNDQIIVTLSADHRVRMIIRYKMDESHIPMIKNLVIRAFVIGIQIIVIIINIIMFVKIIKAADRANIKENDTTNSDEYDSIDLKTSICVIKKSICEIEKIIDEAR
ncbi:nuclear pore complex protein GP210 [Arabidopsis lyrata subsp. lyrata]|uniref:nuclear pore complex protein GP210 n=1 Tax=Arabidopsis lyrata subsp. lyrata TaxID=81972 RepID=UPI000A29D255|nr:nuclear pore complex protein GP210 [Arabidopsis lyrata subsp. lyrata]|eukprot:XP_002873466.2 nuclear pore complex protein GP210 [Arabidopsis lyrata subsp. lyrata]